MTEGNLLMTLAVLNCYTRKTADPMEAAYAVPSSASGLLTASDLAP